MKATGIVRRIDDLGRVVIPKEIRRTMRIREGDPSNTLLILAKKLAVSSVIAAKQRLWGLQEVGKYNKIEDLAGMRLFV